MNNFLFCFLHNITIWIKRLSYSLNWLFYILNTLIMSVWIIERIWSIYSQDTIYDRIEKQNYSWRQTIEYTETHVCHAFIGDCLLTILLFLTFIITERRCLFCFFLSNSVSLTLPTLFFFFILSAVDDCCALERVSRIAV